MTIVPGQWGTRNDSRYGCSMHAFRGDKVCTNNLLVSQRAIEEQILAGLQSKVLHPDVVEYTFRRFEKELARSLSQQNGEASCVRRRLELVERQIRNCTEAIAGMGLSNSLRERLAGLETEQRELSET